MLAPGDYIKNIANIKVCIKIVFNSILFNFC